MNCGRVLVVDDDPNIRLLLTASLEFEGLEVQTAPDGATALALCATRTFDLFLIDYLLPGMDGLALALLADLRSSQILVHRDRLARRHAPATVNRYLASLSAVLSAAMLDWEWLEASPMARVRALPEPRGRVRYLSDAERPRLLQTVQASHEPALAVVVLLAIATGARKGELLQLRWRDVDWTRQQLVFHHTKNHERRTVPVRGEAWTRLEAWAGGVARIGPDWVFPRPAGTKPLDIRYAWEQARARAGLEDFRFHDLRHSTASYLAMSGASLVEIAEVLGHKTLQMVRRYAHLSEAHTAGVLERMVGRFLE